LTAGKKKLLTNLLRAAVTMAALWFVISQVSLDDKVTLSDGTQYVGRVWEHDADKVIIVLSDPQMTRKEVSPDQIKQIPIDPSRPETKSRPAIDLGMVTLVKRLKLPWLALACLLYPACQLIGAFRWRMLMGVHDIRPAVSQTVRLTFIGFAWSLIFPGVTGGDLVKSYYIAKQTVKKAIAVLTVFLDRIVGLVGMAMLSGAVILMNLGRPELQAASRIIGIFLALMMAAGLVFFSHRLRRAFGFEWMLGLLPFKGIVKELDRAAFTYRGHKRTVGVTLAISIVIDVLTVLTFWSIGQALGMKTDIHHYFIFIPVILMISSIPVALAGIGVLEVMFQNFFTLPGVGGTAEVGLALVILFRGVTVWTALPGILMSLTGVHPSEDMARELEADQQVERDTE